MPSAGATGYAFFGLTVLVSLLVAALAFAVMRFAAAARDARLHARASHSETAWLSAALEEAIAKLKTQERATAARAEASERLNSEIVASLTSGLLVVDGQGALQIMNPAARRILDLPATAPGAPAATVLSGMPALAALIDAGLGSGSALVRRTIRFETADGPAFLGVSVSPLPAPTGERHSIVCLFTDLTSVIALEEQLRLKEALARLGELTAGLAHEFRNGLATIHGYARLLDPGALPESVRPYVEGIRAETEAMRQVVTNFLNFARPEPLSLVPVDLEDVIRRAADDLPAGARVAIAGAFGTIDGDEVLLRRAFGNLLRNGVEACAAEGRDADVDVIGDRVEGGSRVRVSVRDRGAGLSPAALPHLFRPFFTTKGHGTGLGLAIVQKVIVSHNGHVSARNHPQGGAEFRVTLPIAGAEPIVYAAANGAGSRADE
ncbi:MAG: hypothetical protein LC791_13460 [Acidobacteria bacterium]|nr:hypothetical protein [Acidobacteriota bacterium]